MDISFDNIKNHVIPMDDFSMKWRFTEESHDKLSEIGLNQLKPLDVKASGFLSDYIASSGLHKGFPFKENFFTAIHSKRIDRDNEDDVKQWLFERGIAADEEVYLSWQSDTAMIVPWNLFIKYFDAFYYSVSDDLTLIDRTLSWALLFFHNDEIYFGRKEAFDPAK